MAGILIIGYGNPGRADDGLGPAFIDKIERLNISNVIVESDYQLSVEHAYDIAESEIAILVDADTSCKEPFEIKRVFPTKSFTFSTHSISPGSLAALTKDFSGKEKDIYMIGIRGYEFNLFKEELSEKAKENLNKTLECIGMALESTNLEELQKNSITYRGGRSNGRWEKGYFMHR